jgi:ADP-heptose:LPS heptosyltransferase
MAELERQNIRQILVIQTAFIGDAILATAVLEKLHAHYPEAAIDFLVRKGNESLFVGHPFLRSVLVRDKKSGQFLFAFFLRLTELGDFRDDRGLLCLDPHDCLFKQGH